jgi:CheW-like protein
MTCTTRSPLWANLKTCTQTLILSRLLASTISPADPATVHPDFDPAADSRSLVFRIAGRAYACAVSAVREVVPLDRLARLPGAPVTILGLINVRGSIVTVVNAAAVLHSGDAVRAMNMVLVVDVGARGVGLAVERVADVRALRPEEGYTELDVREIAARVVAISEDE